MRTTWVVVLAFFAIAAIAAGCGGDTSTGYKDVDLYGEETGGAGSAPAPAPAGESGVSSLPPQDVSAPGWAKREYVGGASRGEEISQADYREFSSVGKDVVEAHKLYEQYFMKKSVDGSKDAALLQRALSAFDQLLPRVEALLDKYSDNSEVQSYLSTVTEDRRALAYEQ